MKNSYLDSLFGLHGQTAVVIGGTGVLGGRMAQSLALAGAKVVLGGRDVRKGKETVDAIINGGGSASCVEVDVADRSSLLAFRDRTHREHGDIDVLVNAAGVNSAVPYFSLTESDWQNVLDVNLTGLHHACQLFAENMVKRGQGSIINVTSVSAHIGLSRVFAYSASKAAVLNYTRNLARELASKGVRVNALAPGFFPAEQNRKILDAERTARVMERTPMARFGEPGELDGALLLLASNHAGQFITGAEIVVDGGFTAMSI